MTDSQVALREGRLRPPHVAISSRMTPECQWRRVDAVWRLRACLQRAPDLGRRVDSLASLAAAVMAVGIAAQEPAPIEYAFDRPLVLST